MVKSTIAFWILAIVFIILAKLPDLSTGYNLWVREIIDKDFYHVYDVEELGKIYHSKTFYMPDDSLVEYYWNDNYILIGNFNISDANQEKYSLSLLQEQENIEKTIKLFPVEYFNNEDILIEDTLLVARSIDSNEDLIMSRIGICSYTKIVYIYGKDYSLEETCKLGVFLLYNDILEYCPELLSTPFMKHPSVL